MDPRVFEESSNAFKPAVSVGKITLLVLEGVLSDKHTFCFVNLSRTNEKALDGFHADVQEVPTDG